MRISRNLQHNPTVFSKLDIFLFPQYEIPLVQSYEIWYNSISDNSFVFLELAFEKTERGPGL